MSLFTMVNKRVMFQKGKRASAKKKKYWADATSKDSIYIPTFSQNKSAFPFQKHFPKKNLLQSKLLMSSSWLFPPVFWFA